MDFIFEWDKGKAVENLRKHQISFEEAETVFYDPLAFTIADEEHSTQEPRYWNVGRSNRERILLVVYTEVGNIIRIISCRAATAKERKTY